MPYGSRTAQDHLRSMARERIADGSLPLIFPPPITDAGHGSGLVCHLCAQRIGRYRVQYDVADFRHGCALRFHIACYLAWQLECVEP